MRRGPLGSPPKGPAPASVSVPRNYRPLRPPKRRSRRSPKPRTDLLRRRHGAGHVTENIEPMAAPYAASQAPLVGRALAKPCPFDEAEFDEMYREALPLFAH